MQSNGKLDCNVQEKRIQERIPLSTVTEKITIGEIIGEIQNRQPRSEWLEHVHWTILLTGHCLSIRSCILHRSSWDRWRDWSVYRRIAKIKCQIKKIYKIGLSWRDSIEIVRLTCSGVTACAPWPSIWCSEPISIFWNWAICRCRVSFHIWKIAPIISYYTFLLCFFFSL